jgi:hypothetical protein
MSEIDFDQKQKDLDKKIKWMNARAYKRARTALQIWIESVNMQLNEQDKEIAKIKKYLKIA